MFHISRSFLLAVSVTMLPTMASARAPTHRDRVHHRLRVIHQRPAPGYGINYSPTPDCRYPDGTPFDPDIIGGPNHVGDGGPAVNLGGSSPCGY